MLVFCCRCKSLDVLTIVDLLRVKLTSDNNSVVLVSVCVCDLEIWLSVLVFLFSVVICWFSRHRYVYAYGQASYFCLVSTVRGTCQCMLSL